MKRDLILILKITNFLKKSYPPFFFPKNVAGSRKWGLLPLKTGVFPKAFKFQKGFFSLKGLSPKKKTAPKFPKKNSFVPEKISTRKKFVVVLKNTSFAQKTLSILLQLPKNPLNFSFTHPKNPPSLLSSLKREAFQKKFPFPHLFRLLKPKNPLQFSLSP